MRFNKNKSVIVIHKKATRYGNMEEIQNLKKVEDTKVLGY